MSLFWAIKSLALKATTSVFIIAPAVSGVKGHNRSGVEENTPQITYARKNEF